MNRPLLVQSVIVLLLLAGCASNSVPTRYYSLAALDTAGSPATPIAANVTLGIGPLEMPETLDRIGIVSIKSGNELNVSTYNIWAGDLRESVLRVLADNISSQLDHDRVWSFPWDNRNRPEYQLRIVIEEFSGQMGKDVSLRAKWTLLGEFGRKELLTRRSSFAQEVEGRSYRSYVAALNTALNNFSGTLATEIATTLASPTAAVP